MRFLLAVIVAVMTGMGSPTWAYEEGSVTDGGRLVGTNPSMVIWHPYLGGTKEQIITIQPKSQAKVDLTVCVPRTGR